MLIGEEFRRFKHHILRGVLRKRAYIARVDEVFNTKTAVLVVDYKQKVNPRQHGAVENDNDASEEDIEREAAVEVIQEFEGGAERIDE